MSEKLDNLKLTGNNSSQGNSLVAEIEKKTDRGRSLERGSRHSIDDKRYVPKARSSSLSIVRQFKIGLTKIGPIRNN